MTPNRPAHPGHATDLSTFAPEVHRTPRERTHPAALTAGKTGSTQIVVVGAGVFGGWTALQLLRRGFAVTLVDTWGPGNARSSSGDETRVIRCMYGANRMYFDLTLRAFALWQDFERQAGRQLLYPTGALWLLHDARDPTIGAAIPMLQDRGVLYREMSIAEASRLYPLISFAGLDHVLLEPHAGYLRARESCLCVVEAFLREGGQYRQTEARPGSIRQGQLQNLQLSDGSVLTADAYVFAGGPWLKQLFPEVLGTLITSVRQEVYYFGTPVTHTAAFDQLPVWLDWNLREGVYYGIPGSAGRGFKVAFDRTESPFFDPTHGDRQIDPTLLARAREFMAGRFPAMQHAPLLESRVCQYPSTPDGNFIVDTHPGAANVWLVGGGSGHGFKMGPALGELATGILLGEVPHPALFALSRFQA